MNENEIDDDSTDGASAELPFEKMLTATVGEGEAGLRLDAWLAAALPSLSRTRIKALIKEGAVSDDSGHPITNPSSRTEAGEVYQVEVPPPIAAKPKGQPISLDVVFEDSHLIVVNKPAGLVVHPGAGNIDNTMVNALIAHCGDSLSGIGGVARPGIVHRIDKDTSGLLVVAKNDATHHGLAEQFAEHSIDRIYTAIAWGVPRPLNGKIEGNIGRHRIHRRKMALVTDGGKPAVTFYELEKKFGETVSQIKCRLSTGRTHQIRVHLAYKGHPLLGDLLYGGKRHIGGDIRSTAAGEAISNFPRQALHAASLGFEHPATGERMHFEAELPGDIKSLVDLLETL